LNAAGRRRDYLLKILTGVEKDCTYSAKSHGESVK
jgi:hypothetical protein